MPTKTKVSKPTPQLRQMPGGSPLCPRESLLRHLADHVYLTTPAGARDELLGEALDERNRRLKPAS